MRHPRLLNAILFAVAGLAVGGGAVAAPPPPRCPIALFGAEVSPDDRAFVLAAHPCVAFVLAAGATRPLDSPETPGQTWGSRDWTAEGVTWRVVWLDATLRRGDAWRNQRFWLPGAVAGGYDRLALVLAGPEGPESAALREIAAEQAGRRLVLVVNPRAATRFAMPDGPYAPANLGIAPGAWWWVSLAPEDVAVAAHAGDGAISRPAWSRAYGWSADAGRTPAD